ncbi:MULTISPECIES: acyl-CoA dehydrogenase family protein [unclassified Pseudoclavibacter]|uniref:acyl-CoA dehydrogenase family protein n=1 Tax=unclassified Pseudoclavibacter TaxID=2615177 RepID=UPI000CE8C119|nr:MULTISPECIES: acyl-CoA dehydrogenase family protein [unclassified Pseudoclavibacter]MBF4552356.1 acyl-CoA dehydrogenase family protein [Pseudoclavibacter sp. VKM Ac-2888]PPF36484.1 acyl-CoA dehydrogenase [Pseudoclavibacter sp. AY1H1]PPF74448.1 acyl-CoA dehydrogenase [Pseudoclavibacter sp. Z016]PPG05033.1 acyl-CoA dehydrogenase [Pseudoclavibacter sp. RFBI5]
MDDNELQLLPGDFTGLEAELSAEERGLIAKLREYLERDVRPVIDEHWEAATFPTEIVKGLAEAGVVGLAFEETRPFPNSAVFRGWTALELARVDASVATYVGVQNGLALGAIGLCGSDAQRERWLPALASGELIGAFGLTEPGSGSDSARGLTTTAERVGDEWVLNGAKRWIGNATFADIVVIWAKDVADGQVKGFVVDTSLPGFTATKIERKVSLRIVQNADITLDGVRVPADAKLEHANSFKDTATVLRQTRAEVAWLATGIAVGAYEAALAYAKERIQFGAPIAARQLIQERLVDALGLITSSITLCVRISQLGDADAQKDEHSALAKAVATGNMRKVVALAREVCGGNGIVADYGVGRFFADAEAIYSYEGTREMNTLIVGRSITGHAAFV